MRFVPQTKTKNREEEKIGSAASKEPRRSQSFATASEKAPCSCRLQYTLLSPASGSDTANAAFHTRHPQKDRRRRRCKAFDLTGLARSLTHERTLKLLRVHPSEADRRLSFSLLSSFYLHLSFTRFLIVCFSCLLSSGNRNAEALYRSLLRHAAAIMRRNKLVPPDI